MMSEPAPTLQSLPNEIKQIIFRKMNFGTSLSARQCFREFDELSKVFSRKFPVNIRVKYVTNDNMEIFLYDCGGDQGVDDWTDEYKIANWMVVHGEPGFCNIFQKDVTRSRISTKTCHNRVVSDAGNQFVGKLFKNKLFDVKKLEIDFGQYERFLLRNINFHLSNWPLDLLVVKNYVCPPPYFYTLIEKNFQISSLAIRLDDFERRRKRRHEEIQKAERDASRTFRQFIVKFTGFKNYEDLLRNRSSVDWKKVINDLMCIRAAYYFFSEQYFQSAEGNFDEQIRRLKADLDDHDLGVDVVALLSALYLSKFQKQSVNFDRFSSVLMSLISEKLKSPCSRDTVEILMKKIEWLRDGSDSSRV